MPIDLNFYERIGLLKLNRGPAPMADLLGLLAGKAVYTALRLGIFESLAAGKKPADEIAAAIGADQSGISLLLGALENLGYVKSKGGAWRNTSMTEKWMLAVSPTGIADLFHQFNDMASRWDYLHESIRTGRPPVLGYEWLDRHPERWELYQAGLRSAAKLICGEILKKTIIPPAARTILDLGGGHGQYCIEFCKKHALLSGTIYDWPQTKKTALANIASSGLAGRVKFKAGDFVKDDFGAGNDVILLFNVIRIFNSEELGSLFRKVHDSLSRHGTLIIMDHLGHMPRSRFMKANAFLILLELYNSTKGYTHKAAAIMSYLRENGFSEIHEKELKRSPGLGMVSAVKR
jgi:hypothetical protein